MMKSFNPWEGMQHSASPSNLSLRLIEGDFADGICANWAVTYLNEVGLYIEALDGERYLQKTPMLKNINVTVGGNSCDNNVYILILLTNEDSWLPFQHLCEDLLWVLKSAKPSNFASIVLERLSRWRTMLAADRGELTFNQQKGLVAELHFLKEIAFNAVGERAALESWTGCFDAPRDYTFGNTFVEVKAYQGSQKPSVSISSEFQLSCNPDENVFLYAVELNKATVGGKSLKRYVDEIRAIVESDSLSSEMLETRLYAAGYEEKYDYSIIAWDEGETSVLVVEEDFPKIDAKEVPTGISSVKYQLDLRECANFLLDEKTLIERIGK